MYTEKYVDKLSIVRKLLCSAQILKLKEQKKDTLLYCYTVVATNPTGNTCSKSAMEIQEQYEQSVQS